MNYDPQIRDLATRPNTELREISSLAQNIVWRCMRQYPDDPLCSWSGLSIQLEMKQQYQWTPLQ
jgi:hypothetical protein